MQNLPIEDYLNTVANKISLEENPIKMLKRELEILLDDKEISKEKQQIINKVKDFFYRNEKIKNEYNLLKDKSDKLLSEWQEYKNNLKKTKNSKVNLKVIQKININKKFGKNKR